MKRKHRLIELKPRFCKGQLYRSADQNWISNGHWLLRPAGVKFVRSTPEFTRDDTPMDQLLSTFKEANYQRAHLTDVRMHGSRMLYRDDGVVTWVDSYYAQEILVGEEFIWSYGLWDPVFVTYYGQRLPDALRAAVMPTRVPNVDYTPEALTHFKAWVEGL